jgi:hypothetical protein
MLDMYGTPYTQAPHFVERYRLLDYEAAREELERDAKESLVIPNTSMQRDPTYRGKYLQLLFTVEDQGVFTVPWFATITYGRPSGEWEEFVCAELLQEYETLLIEGSEQGRQIKEAIEKVLGTVAMNSRRCFVRLKRINNKICSE